MATASAPVVAPSKTSAGLLAWVYPVALIAAIGFWLVAIRAPFWVDETLAYWQVDGGFAKILSRSTEMPSSLAFLYLLWAGKSVFGAHEIFLRMLPLAAMLGAAYFLYRAARELFDPEIALITCILFCFHRDVLFAAIDVRPYAFALLMTNLAIFAFIRWMARHEMRYAILFGAAAGGILHFHYLFGAVLPAFAIYYLVVRRRFIRDDWKQIGAAVAAGVLVFLPIVPRFVALFHARQAHSFAPGDVDKFQILRTLVPFKMLMVLIAASFLAALVRKLKLPDRETLSPFLLCVLLMLGPIAILYGITVATSTHVLVPRYCLSVAPGVALTWAYLVSRIDSRMLRQLFCLGLLGYTAFALFTSPIKYNHETSFKPSFDFVNANTSEDHAPVLVCSSLIESLTEPLPTELNSENPLISQLWLYRLNSPWTMLPIDANEHVKATVNQVMLKSVQGRKRFLAVAGPESLPMMRWVVEYARTGFSIRTLGLYDDVFVLEFTPAGGDF